MSSLTTFLKPNIYERWINQLAYMIMKMHKLLWKILFSNQKFGLFGVFRDLGPLFLLQNAKITCGGVFDFLKFQAVSLPL